MKRLFILSLLVVVSLMCAAQALTVTDATQFSRSCFLISWTDHLGKARQAWLVKSGDHLGVIQHFTYYDGANLKDIVPGSPNSDPLNSAFGSTTHHGASCHYCGGTMTKRFQGDAMAIFDWNISVDGVAETVTYTFMDGHDYFQWAQTDDLKNATGGGDSRGPYCTMNWNGTGNTAQGVAFGATKYFWQAQYNGPWTLKDTCDVPYAWEWGDGLEIGYIQTQSRRQQLAGAPVLSNQLPASNSTVTDSNATLMDFQMNFYDKWIKITWGMPYGYLSKTGGAVAGQKYAGGQYWAQYSLSIVLDAKTANGVMRVMKENRALHNKTLQVTATAGTLKTTGPYGTKNPNNQTLAPAGWDHNYRAFWVTTAANAAALTFTISSDTVRWVNPTFRLAGMTADPTSVTFNSAALTKGTDYWTSVDAANSEVWVTLNKTISGATNTVVFGTPSSIIPRAIQTAGNGLLISTGTVTLSLYSMNGKLVNRVSKQAALTNPVYIDNASVKRLISAPAKGNYTIRIQAAGLDRKESIVF